MAPHAAQRGTRLRMRMSYNGADFQAVDEAALTVIGVQKVEWVGRQNSVSDEDALDACPNWPAGLSPGSVRVFPDARFVGGAVESTPRDRVDVRVTLTVKPVEPVTMYLRSFDVDDPTAHDNVVDDESTAEDNRGTTPAAA
ncbi:MAG: hypothetical protein EA376_04315 [Phycisphaeraceae bacterium]|nr:MAG: hypothetical protein EA376_04315 [Phycisphaeraceae bacterium]